MAFLTAFVFYTVTLIYYFQKDKREFYQREGLNTYRERFGRYFQYSGSQFSWSKALDPYRGLAPNYIKKTLLVLVGIAIAVQFIPS